MPTPMSGEKKKDYISRCIDMRQSENADEHPDQSVAICNSMWSNAKKLEKIDAFEEPKDSTSQGIVQTQPDQTLPGQYPEFEEVELPASLTMKPWEREMEDLGIPKDDISTGQLAQTGGILNPEVYPKKKPKKKPWEAAGIGTYNPSDGTNPDG